MSGRQSLQASSRAVSEGLPYPTITDLGILPADYPISRVITINEVITLSIVQISPTQGVS
jgi:hypothetical protein